MSQIPTNDSGASLARLIQAEAPRHGSGKRWLIGLAVLALAASAFVAFRPDADSAAAIQYQTTPISRGDLRVTVSATGKLEPTNQVDVGSELSGTIEAVLVDDNDRVSKGQVLARLDVAKLRDQIARSKASVAAAEARVLQAVATVRETRANLGRLQEVAKLSGGKVPARTELGTAEAALERAIADEASVRAAVEETRATLRVNQTDLTKASIRSPIDGVVLARKAEPGQTVAASLQAPVLFTLAENLAQMELQVDVDEADVGQVRAGQSATFTVDAWPARHYPAEIRLVRYGAETVNNVVTYKTLLKVNNDDLSLRPGMTATAEIVTAELDQVLLIPNAALRFTPPQPAEADAKRGGLVGSLFPWQSRSRPRRPANAATTRNAPRQIWMLREGQPAALPVTVGLTDGRMTEVSGEGLEPGLPVITASSGGTR